MTSSDYTQWTPEQLVQRVLQLEQELKLKVDSHTQSATSTTNGNPQQQQNHLSSPAATAPSSEDIKSKPPKERRPFNPDKYMTRHIALKFAYRGALYNGYEHHVNNATPLPTIEEELWKALVRCRLIFPPSLKKHGLDIDVISVDEFGPGKARGPTPVDWEGCDYSKCGRTDRGVSAFGQVVGIRVRSARLKTVEKSELVEEGDVSAAQQDDPATATGQVEESQEQEDDTFNSITDEVPYIALLNRVLPPTIRVLAWCPSTPANFSARFSCREREYRYFFTSPAYLPQPSDNSESGQVPAREPCWLNVAAMQEAASYLVGSHDFRNFCKVDASKQITNFSRKISHASIDHVSSLSSPVFPSALSGSPADETALYAFTVRGSAFLWHQVRCMVAVLFLVGQGLEKPTVIQELLDVEKCVGRPNYEMASDRPLVLWDSKFSASHGIREEGTSSGPAGWDRGTGDDELEWVYAGEEILQNRNVAVGKWTRNGIMEDLWKSWRATKMEEILTAQLMDVVALRATHSNSRSLYGGQSTKVYAGDDFAPAKGKYVPLMQMKRLDPVEVINSRWAERRGVSGRTAANDDADE